MEYVGERIQVDVKYVPKACFPKELVEKDGVYYQYTAMDEKTRYIWTWFSKEKSTYTSIQFVKYTI